MVAIENLLVTVTDCKRRGHTVPQRPYREAPEGMGAGVGGGNTGKNFVVISMGKNK
jgi:hypothetical protein